MHGTGDPSRSFMLQSHKAVLSDHFEWLPYIDMGLSKFDLTRRNAALKWALIYAFSAGVLGGCIPAILAAVSGQHVWGIVAACSFCTFAIISFFVGRGGFRGSLRGAVILQAKYLKQLDADGRMPDLIVGSSFGGLVCACLMAEGKYDGPALLLAPAVCHGPNGSGMFDFRSFCKGRLLHDRELCNKIIVMQGDADKTTRPDKVQEWCQELGIKLSISKGTPHNIFLQLQSNGDGPLLARGLAGPSTPLETPQATIAWIEGVSSTQEWISLPAP